MQTSLQSGWKSQVDNMKFAVVIFILGVSCTQAFDLDTEWENFKLKYEKSYLSAEEVRRFAFSTRVLLLRSDKHKFTYSPTA